MPRTVCLVARNENSRSLEHRSSLTNSRAYILVIESQRKSAKAVFIITYYSRCNIFRFTRLCIHLSRGASHRENILLYVFTCILHAHTWLSGSQRESRRKWIHHCLLADTLAEFIGGPASFVLTLPPVSGHLCYLTGHEGLSAATRKRQPPSDQPVRRLRSLVIGQLCATLNNINLKPVVIASVPQDLASMDGEIYLLERDNKGNLQSNNIDCNFVSKEPNNASRLRLPSTVRLVTLIFHKNRRYM